MVMERRGSSYGMLLSRPPESEIAGDLAGVEFRNNNTYGSKVYLPAFTEKTKQRLSYRDVVQLVRTPGLGPGGRTFESYHPDKETNSKICYSKTVTFGFVGSNPTPSIEGWRSG